VTATAPVAAARPDARERTGGPPPEPRAFADFHIHTRYSRDSLLDEETFVRVALERGLTHVAVTNHNNVEGAVAVRDQARAMGLEDRLTVILGEEVSSADGEIVGLFLERTIPRGLSAEETADEIHAQGGLVSIPHPFDPFRKHHIREVPLTRLAEAGKIDAMEIFNSRVTFQRHNLRAAEFAALHGIPGIAASDSHAGYEVAMSTNVLPMFATAAQLKAALPFNEWHASRSTMLVHLSTRYAVWSKMLRRWMSR
jgi:predicted metal-dependent phosphoesterase TrpH